MSAPDVVTFLRSQLQLQHVHVQDHSLIVIFTRALAGAYAIVDRPRTRDRRCTMDILAKMDSSGPRAKLNEQLVI